MTRTLTARLRSRARTLPQRACAVAVAAVSAVGAPVVLTAGGGEAPAPVAASAETIPLRGVDRARRRTLDPRRGAGQRRRVRERRHAVRAGG